MIVFWILAGAALLYGLAWLTEFAHRPKAVDYVSESWLRENVRQRRE